jgi:hypothetical protein
LNKKEKVNQLTNFIFKVLIVSISWSANCSAKDEDSTKIEHEANRGIRKSNHRLEPHQKLNIYSHRHVIKVSIGYSRALRNSLTLIDQFTDYSDKFTHPSFSPVYSFSHEYYLDNVFSLSYCLGYVNSNVSLNNEKIQSSQVSLFVKPKLNIISRPKFEAYAQLNIGVVYHDMKMSRIESEGLVNQLPPNFKMYTGFTPIGFNFIISEQIWFNAEISLWSYEFANVGFKFKIKENLSHPNNWVAM